ncbi:NAD(P)-dependent oxidoreductase [Micromonospora sp. GCM10011542]|uniref:NAD(P)-dependent oxidoreductase n=1 Tax=Micromonospora sp. GCM10011542 TaxID=3317337 RepID=UPI00360F2A4E
MTEIAVLGQGRMGTAIAQRLLAAGHQVTVWNRTASRTEPARAAGARVAATPADAVRGVEVALTMLTAADAVGSVLFGPDGAAAALAPGATLVEMSTIGPRAVGELVCRLPAGLALVDAPVAGSVDAAAAGTLRVLAGGESATVARVEPVLRALGVVRHCGPTGSGAAAKLVLNAALLVAVTGVADALAVARAVGVDRETAIELLGDSPLGAAVGRATAGGAAFPVALADKDLDLLLGEVDAASVPLVRAARAALATADPADDIAALAADPRA